MPVCSEYVFPPQMNIRIYSFGKVLVEWISEYIHLLKNTTNEYPNIFELSNICYTPLNDRWIKSLITGSEASILTICFNFSRIYSYWRIFVDWNFYEWISEYIRKGKVCRMNIQIYSAGKNCMNILESEYICPKIFEYILWGVLVVMDICNHG